MLYIVLKFVLILEVCNGSFLTDPFVATSSSDDKRGNQEALRSGASVQWYIIAIISVYFK